jgi:twinkle protein
MAIIKANTCIGEYLDAYHNGFAKGLSTGWFDLDRFFTIRPGELTVITGVPSSGKSEFLDAMLVNASKLHNMRSVLFSPENFPIEMHVSKLAEKFIGKSFNGEYSRMSVDEMIQGMDLVNKHFRFFDTSEDIYRTESLIYEVSGFMAASVRVTIPHCFVIDPWNEIDHSCPGDMTATDFTGIELARIRSFAREFMVHVFIVAHPTKLVKDKDGIYPVTHPYDIAGSANFYNKADNCITIWRNAKDAPCNVEVHIQKVRNRATGMQGKSLLQYDFRTRQYTNVMEFQL